MFYSWIQGFWSNLTTMESCFLAQFFFQSDFCNRPTHLCSLLPNPNWKTNTDLIYNKHSIYIALYFLLYHSLFTYLFIYWEPVHKALNLKYRETAFHLSLPLACKMCFYNYKLHCFLQALDLQVICTFPTVKLENRDRVLPVSSNWCNKNEGLELKKIFNLQGRTS